MARYKNKAAEERRWLSGKVWTFPTGLHPDGEEELTRRKSYKSLSVELEAARRQHMFALAAEGASYAIIARLYRLDRSLVRKIILNK